MEGSTKSSLLATYRKIMRPLARILLRYGVSFGEFVEVAKLSFVEVAVRDFKVPGKKTTQSRIAIITGLTRKEVSRVIRESDRLDKYSQSKLNRVARVISGWHTDNEFTGPYGLPRELRFDQGGHGDFVSLVKKFSGDMPARAMLDELQRVGAIEEIDHGWYRILTRTYIPATLSAENIERFGSTIEQFIETVDYNLEQKKTGNTLFERKVIPDNGLLEQDMAAFDEFIKDRGQGFLYEVDNWISTRNKPNPEKGEKAVTTGIGLYHYIDKAIEDKSLKEIYGGEDDEE